MKWTSLGALALMLINPNAASATAFQVVISGILAPGAQDPTDYLGQGTDLAGKRAELIYTFDTTDGVGVSHPFGNANWSEIVDQGFDPGVYLTVRVGTATITTGDAQAKIDKEVFYTYGPKNGYIQGYMAGISRDGFEISSQFSYAFSGSPLFASNNFLSPISVSGNSPYAVGEPNFADFGGVKYSMFYIDPIVFRGDLIPATITIQSAVVPEPAAWWMMIAGFGAAGVMIRRFRLKQTYGATIAWTRASNMRLWAPFHTPSSRR